jgi:dynein heavy chain
VRNARFLARVRARGQCPNALHLRTRAHALTHASLSVPSTRCPPTQATLPVGKLKRKTVYFLKVAPGPLPKEEFEKKIVHGDLCESALEQLSLLAQEVFLPMLCNPHNQAGWPEMVTREVMDNLYKFSASACVTVGLSKGQTLLPVPPVGKSKPKSNKPSHDGDRSIRPSAADSSRGSGISMVQPRETLSGGTPGAQHKLGFGHGLGAAAHAAALLTGSHSILGHTLPSFAEGGGAFIPQQDLDMIHVVESAVVLWTHQIKNVLRTEPDQARVRPASARASQASTAQRGRRLTRASCPPAPVPTLSSARSQALKEGAHPGPLSEIEFWSKKATSLNGIQEQLASPGIHKAMELLKATNSTFFPAFERLCADVEFASKEANSNVQFLTPLKKCVMGAHAAARPHARVQTLRAATQPDAHATTPHVRFRRFFERLSLGDDFMALPEMFTPMFHLVLLVWRHSAYYNSPMRLVVLMREICNDVIEQSVKNCDSGTLFDSLPVESADKLRAALKVCGSLRAAYAAAAEESHKVVPANPWKVSAAAIFTRFDAFVERCTDLMDLFHTASQFGRLERVEIGGTKGRALTASVRAVHADFTSAVARFHLVSYDVMDTDSGVFEADYAAFRSAVRELERRLAALIGTALDDCSSVGRTFKLLDSFEGVMERDVIAAELEKKHVTLLRAFAADIKEVHDVFTAGRTAPQLSKNAAPNSGAVAWLRALLQRVEEPFERLRQMGQVLTATPEGVALDAQYTQLVTALKEAEGGIVLDWSSRAEELGDERLKQSLLVRDETTGMVSVNFDPALTKLLREVRYFMLQGVEIPPGAAQVFKRSETLRQQTGNLELVAGLYNNAQRVLLAVERPLVDRKLENVDAALERGQTVLNWNSPKVDEYIQEVMAQVKDLDAIVEQLKGSVAATEKILQGWAKKPMFDRRDGRTYSPEEFRESHRAHLAARHAEVTEGAAEIARLMNASAKKLLVRSLACACPPLVCNCGPLLTRSLPLSLSLAARTPAGAQDGLAQLEGVHGVRLGHRHGAQLLSTRALRRRHLPCGIACLRFLAIFASAL